MAALVVRRAEADDAEWVANLASRDRGLIRQRFGDFNVPKLIEQSYLSITAANASGEVVGFAAFSDAPTGDAGGVNAENWLEYFATRHGVSGVALANTLWLSFFVAHESYALDATEHICRAVFTTLPDTNATILLLPKTLDIFSPLTGTFNEVLPVAGDGGAAADAADKVPGAATFNRTRAFSCSREAFTPTMRIRAARVEDHDDLVPIFNAQSEVLTDLYGEFFLAELIESQDSNNKALVAEVDGRASGLMALTSDMQLEVLQRCFDLAPYNNLLKRTRGELAKEAEAQRRNLRDRKQWLQLLHLHAEELAAAFDTLCASSTDAEEVVKVDELIELFNRRGQEWGFLGRRPKQGLGTVMARDLALSAGSSITRDDLNLAVDGYANAQADNRKARNVHAWYHLHNGRATVLKAFATAAAFEEKDGQADAEGEQDMSPEAVAEREEKLEAARVALGDLAALVGMLVREAGEKDGKYLGENVGDELLDQLGLDDVATADADEEESEVAVDEEGSEAGEGKGEDAEEGKGEAAEGEAAEGKGEEAGEEGKGAEEGAGEEGEAGGEEAGEEGKGEEELQGDPIVRVSRAQVITALDRLEAIIRAEQSTRVAVIGPPCVGKQAVARELAARQGLAAIDLSVTLSSAGKEAEDVIEAALANEEEPVNKEEYVLNALVTRLKQEDCNKGWAFYNVPTDVAEASRVFRGLTARRMRSHVVVVTAPDRVARQYKFGEDAPSQEQEDKYTSRAVLWRRKGNSLTAAVKGKLAKVVRVENTGSLEAAVGEVELSLYDLGVQPTPYQQDEEDSEALPQDLSAPEGAESNSFAITLFCLDELFESRARDFLQHAFDMFEDREYCLLTLPHGSAESLLLSQFWQVPARPESTFSHVLYVLHRASLGVQNALCVREATVEDHLPLTQLVGGLDSTAELLEAVAAAEHASGAIAEQQQVAFVAECHGQVVGVAVMSRASATKAHMDGLQSQFEMDRFLQMQHYNAQSFVTLEHWACNPLFTGASSYILRQCLRQYGADVVLYRRHVDAPAPLPVTSSFVQVRSRRTPVQAGEPVPGTAAFAEADGKEAEGPTGPVTDPSDPRFSLFALFFISKKLTSEPKVVVNSRIVVVGASDTSLAFVETLLMTPYLHFPNLVLISPGGLPSAGSNYDGKGPSPWSVQSLFTPEELARLALDARVRVVDSAVTEIDRESKAVILPGDVLVPYDRLVIATGLQDQTPRRVVVDVEDSGVYGTRVLGVGHHGDVEALEAAVEELRSCEPTPSDVIVYGNSLDALSAIQALLSRGISADRIRQMVPPGAPNALDSENVATFIDNAIIDLGIDILHGATLVEAGPSSSPDGSLYAVVDLGGEGDNEAGGRDRKQLRTQLVLCAGQRDVDARLFAAVNGCGLVYDGRLVVNHRFRTTQPEIFAGGSVAKFSRRYRSKQWLQAFNAREVGAAVAFSLLQELDPMAGGAGDDGEMFTEQYASGAAALPKFGLPRVQQATLPGGNHFLDVQLPQQELGDGSVSRELATRGGSDEAPNFCRVVLDRFGRVCRLTYVGGGRVESDNLASLVGRHASFLNSLVRDFDQGRISDLVSFFRGDWAMALYHDRFDSMVLEMREALRDDEGVNKLLAQMAEAVEGGKSDEELLKLRATAIGPNGGALGPSTRRTIEAHVLEFLRANRALLPMYFLPGLNKMTSRAARQ